MDATIIAMMAVVTGEAAGVAPLLAAAVLSPEQYNVMIHAVVIATTGMAAGAPVVAVLHQVL